MNEQERIKQLEDLLKDFYSEARIGASMEDPTDQEITDYTQRMLNLMERTETLLPELTEDEPYISDEEEWGGPTGEIVAIDLPVDDALENPRLDRDDSVIRNSRIW